MKEEQVLVKYFNSSHPFDFLLVPNESDILISSLDDRIELSHSADGKSTQILSLKYSELTKIEISKDSFRTNSPRQWILVFTVILSLILVWGVFSERLEYQVIIIYLFVIQIGFTCSLLFPKRFRILQLEFGSKSMQFAFSPGKHLKKIERIKNNCR